MAAYVAVAVAAQFFKDPAHMSCLPASKDTDLELVLLLLNVSEFLAYFQKSYTISIEKIIFNSFCLLENQTILDS